MSAAKKNSLEQGISPISQEEFIRDFLPLPILHRGILFVLRTGYLIKQSPLEDLDVLGLCPTHTAEEEGALHVVLRRFFNRDASFWRSAAYDAIIQEELETKAHHKLLSEQRSIKSKRAAEARWKENGAPSNAPSIKNDAPSNAPSINNDAPSNAPGINNDAPSNAPSIKNDATSNAPSMTNYAQKTLDPLGHRVFQGKADIIENPGNVQQEEPRARTRAHRSDRISDINLINKNINKSESVSESDRRLKIKNLFAREKSVWMIGEVLEVLVFFGLDEKALARWRSRNPENQNFILELAAGGMSRFDYDTIAQVFARCQAAKDKEGKPLSSAVAFVLKSLQHELTAVSNRKNARQSASESAQPKRFRDIDYMEGIERLNPDGTFVLKRKTEGR